MGGKPPPRDSGLYRLLVELRRERHLRVGALGRATFPPGYYLYVGRAMVRLKARLARHLRKRKPLRWHVDYLLARGRAVRVEVRRGSRPEEECREARRWARLSRGRIPLSGFGSSDCRCPAHLFYLGPKCPASLGGRRWEGGEGRTLLRRA